MIPTEPDDIKYSINRHSAALEQILIAYEDLRQARSEAGLDTDQVDDLIILLQTAFNKASNTLFEKDKDEFADITIDTPPAEIMAVKTSKPWAEKSEERKKPEAKPLKRVLAEPVQAAPRPARVSPEMKSGFR